MKLIKLKSFLGAKIIIASFMLILLIGCNSSSVRFYNRASDNYELFIDGKSYGTVPANRFIDISVEAGKHKFKVVQTEGFFSFPTEYTKDVSVEAGKNLEWSWENLVMPSN